MTTKASGLKIAPSSGSTSSLEAMMLHWQSWHISGGIWAWKQKVPFSLPSKRAALDLWDTTVDLESLCWLQQRCSRFPLWVLSPGMLCWVSAARSLLEVTDWSALGSQSEHYSSLVLCGSKVNSEGSSLPPVSRRWVIERNHRYECGFTQPHIRNAGVELRKLTNFKTFLSSSPAPSVFQTEGWKTGRYYSQ